jgi:hypothetical protein
MTKLFRNAGIAAIAGLAGASFSVSAWWGGPASIRCLVLG